MLRFLLVCVSLMLTTPASAKPVNYLLHSDDVVCLFDCDGLGVLTARLDFTLSSEDFGKEVKIYGGNIRIFDGANQVFSSLVEYRDELPTVEGCADFCAFAETSLDGTLTGFWSRCSNCFADYSANISGFQTEYGFASVFASGTWTSITNDYAPVPLPAALPAFLAVLIGLFGFRALRSA